jgi:pyruvate formate lyase activating enzyme
MPVEAAWYETLESGKTRCLLCPRGCVRGEGEAGFCLGRVTRDGKLWAESYGEPASVAVDPMEKKPLYHFHPGRSILSLGTYGCNFACEFCQNWTLAQTKVDTRHLAPEQVVELTRGRQAAGVAYTYNEPTIWFEYVRDCSRLLREAGLLNVLVSNGYVNQGPLEELLPTIDALNIDIKAFRDDFYREICGGQLQPVLDAARAAARQAHVEITNLIIPGRNDDPSEQDEMAAWIAAEMGPQTPVHLSAYTPRHRLQAEPTTLDHLLAGRERFGRHLRFVYLGNILSADGGLTRCPACEAEVVRRSGYATETPGLAADGTCAACGADCNIVL